jgi:hypothetical protein
MRFISHSIIVLLFGGVFLFGAHANTLVIVLRTEQAIFVAADSKLADTDGGDRLPVCKIHIADQFVWATSGILNDKKRTFDTWATVEAAIKAGGSLSEVIERIDEILTSQLKQLLPGERLTDPRSYDIAVSAGHPITIYFIQNTDFRMSDFTLPNKEAPARIEVVNQSCPGDLCAARSDTISMMGFHEAAQAELARNPQIWDQMGIIPALSRLMDIQHNATPTMVAGPVSILRIDKSGALSWLQKGICAHSGICQRLAISFE